MSNDYKEGPRSEPWEVSKGAFVQRRDQEVRRNPNEIIYFIAAPERAAYLAARLNRLDALEAALTRLADAVEVESRYRHHMAYVDVMAARGALKAALVAAREVLR
jgi:hypothetical protein